MSEPSATPPRLGVAEAVALILDGAAPLGAESVPLAAAHGRVLAEPVVAPRDLPPWPNASMDGYAVRAADVASAPARLRVVEEIPAGARPARRLAPGEAARIMTGAPLPDGADSVIRIEDTDRGREVVEIRDARDTGMNVRPRGEDARAGAVAVDAGTLLDAGNLGMLAAVGAAAATVHRRPRVAILSAGDELVPLEAHDRALATGRIVDVNAVTLAASVETAGGVPVPLGLAPDDPAAIRRLIEEAPPFDVLLTSGGVSAGDHDHTRAVLRELGAEILIHRLRIRPGAPLGFGLLGDARWIGLPGNPVSALVTFEVFVRPLLRRLGGHRRLHRATVPVRLCDAVRTAAPLTHFLRAVISRAADGQLEARLTGPQGSGLVSSMARADALVIVPEECREVAAGAVLEAMLLGDRALHAEHPPA